jgi:hypothetical protein
MSAPTRALQNLIEHQKEWNNAQRFEALNFKLFYKTLLILKSHSFLIYSPSFVIFMARGASNGVLQYLFKLHRQQKNVQRF